MTNENSGGLKRIDKPWGYELVWAHTDRYVGKILHVNRGGKLSMQYHKIKDETIMLMTGKIIFEVEEGGRMIEKELVPMKPYHIRPGTKHRMTALDDADILEVSTPELDDVVRLEDAYGRI